MPPKRKAAAPKASGTQSTLAFHGQITKAGKVANVGKDAIATSQATKKKVEPVEIVTRGEDRNEEEEEEEKEEKIEELAQSAPSAATEEEKEAPILAPADEPQPEVVEVPAVKPVIEAPSKEEEEARNVKDAQVKAYWKDKEASRKAPRVHQEELGLHEKILREWDISNQYGPCIGINRMKRWKRAHRLGLRPPIEVLAVLIQEQEKESSSEVSKVQQAYVDKLMNSHAA